MAFFCISCKSSIESRFKACPFCGEPITDFLRRHLEEPPEVPGRDGSPRPPGLTERLGGLRVGHAALPVETREALADPEVQGGPDIHASEGEDELGAGESLPDCCDCFGRGLMLNVADADGYNVQLVLERG